jgi:hypothetical protein
MTFEERASQLMSRFALTPRQARFLVLVALIGGYCLRRQYTAFAGISTGKNPRAFLDGLVARHLAARTHPRGNRGYLYHVKARALYDALDLSNNRNRRMVSAPRQARRLMLLDYAIAHPNATWYATEHDKVELFTTAFHVATANLPGREYQGVEGTATLRHFVAKFPIYFVPGDPTLCFLTLGLETTGRTVARFLTDHAALLRELPAWRLIVIHPRIFRAGIDAWNAAFGAQHFTAPISLSHPERLALHAYFRVRHALAGGQGHALTIDRGHEERRRRFAGTAYDALYRFWCIEQGPTRSENDPPDFSDWRPNGAISMYELPYSYDLFGRYPGVA